MSVAFSPGITIRSDSDRPFRVSARPYRNASIAGVIEPVDIAPAGPVAAMVRADAMCRRHGIDLV